MIDDFTVRLILTSDAWLIQDENNHLDRGTSLIPVADISKIFTMSGGQCFPT